MAAGRLSAKLLFTWNTVVIAIYFDAGTMFQKVCGFLTGMHLRTVRAAIAGEMLRRVRHQGIDCRGRLHLQGRRAARVGLMTEFLLEVPCNHAEQNKNEEFFHDR
jgi:hypothetical protein